MFYISTIYFGKKKSEEYATFDFVTFKTKKKDKKSGKPNNINFLKDTNSSQMIKVPRSIDLKPVEGIHEEVIDEEIDTIKLIDTVIYDSHFIGKREEENASAVRPIDVVISLNKNTLSPYVVEKNESDKEEHYHYACLTIDTSSYSLIKCDDCGNVMNTFKQPKDKLLGCLIEFTNENNEVSLYLKDEGKFGFKKVTLRLSEDAESIEMETTTKLTKEELSEIRFLWNKKPKTRTFQYTYNFLPSARIGYSKKFEDDSIIEVMTREEAGSEEKYLEEIQKSIVKAVGFMPKSVILESDMTDFKYEDMVKLHFNYVFSVRENGIVTVKSN